MKDIYIYLAGKISKGDWRAYHIGRKEISFFDALYEGGPIAWEPVEFMPGVWYTGPFFIGCDHGCYHGNNTHGAGSGSGCSEPGPLRTEIVDLCKLAIARSNVFFAWIDTTDCFGTIVELGYAALFRDIADGARLSDRSSPEALERHVWVAGPGRFTDMWFVYEMADRITFDHNNPHDALSYFLSDLQRVDYREYIQSPEWRERAEEAKARAGQRCQVCNRHRNEIVLDAHHRTYERLGNELPEDITVLCRECHALYEQARKNGNR